MPLPTQLRDHLRIPVLAAPMFIVSGPDLVIEQCKAGVIGAFPALNARPQEELDKWLTRTETEITQYQREHPDKKVAPYAVNLIMNKANKRLDADLEVVLAHKVPIVITSLSAPTALVPRVHEYGGIVFHDVIKVRHAEKALEAGVDGLIAVCGGAGGHAGNLNPFALVNVGSYASPDFADIDGAAWQPKDKDASIAEKKALRTKARTVIPFPFATPRRANSSAFRLLTKRIVDARTALNSSTRSASR